MTNRPRTVAFQGIGGAHSDAACRRAYPEARTIPSPAFEDVIEAVRSGGADLGFLPVENSRAGRVAEIHHLLPGIGLFITAEHFHHVHHHLLGTRGAKVEAVRHVYSHPQALLQCRSNLRDLGVEPHPYLDTALAAKDVAGWNDPSKGALASREAAGEYGLDILRENVQDSDENITVFSSVSREPADPDPAGGTVLTSLVFTARNIPAALFKALGGFATNQVNLIKLESYIPAKSKGLARFFVTFVGRPEDRPAALALEELGFFSEEVTLLGSYLADQERFR